MTRVRQDEPPAASRTGRAGKYDWDEIVRELTEAPGTWLLIDDKASRGLATAIKRQKMAALQDPDWVFSVTTRKNDREAGTAEVWMSALPADQTGEQDGR